MEEPFLVKRFRIDIAYEAGQLHIEATVKIAAKGETALTTAEGDTPMEALNKAICAALSILFKREFTPVAILSEQPEGSIKSVFDALVAGYTAQVVDYD